MQANLDLIITFLDATLGCIYEENDNHHIIFKGRVMMQQWSAI